jgi:uncharacterized protein (DUF58 family)
VITIRLEPLPPRRIWATLTLHETVGDVAFPVVAVRRGTARYCIPSLPRGRHPITASALVASDHLGLARREIPLPESPGDIVVHPRIVQLTGVFTTLEGRLGRARGPKVSRRRGPELHTVREHERGEPLTAVNWPSTARLGRLMVKQGEEGDAEAVTVILDCDQSTCRGAPGCSSFDEQVRIAGSLLPLTSRPAGRLCSRSQTAPQSMPTSSLRGGPTRLSFSRARGQRRPDAIPPP